MPLRPVRLKPIFVPRIWGARTLAPLFPEKSSLPEAIGEVWLTGDDCRFADGPCAGERLGDAWLRMGEEWAGKLVSRQRKQFPILAKFIFPEDKLSVQVHPDNDYASRYEAAAGGIGKTEMWYVVSAHPGAEVRVGLKPHVTPDEFRRAIADGSAEELLERMPVQAGDAIFVPAGTVHTIGPGMVLCEIQQNSDLTYRVFDFHRLDSNGQARELHIEKAFDVIRFGRQSASKVSPIPRQDEIGEGTRLVECPYFTVAKRKFETTSTITCQGRFELMIVVEGNGSMRTNPGNECVEYSRAQIWLLPCALREMTFTPNEPTTVLRVTPPL